jgi:hypothetical protein
VQSNKAQSPYNLSTNTPSATTHLTQASASHFGRDAATAQTAVGPAPDTQAAHLGLPPQPQRPNDSQPGTKGAVSVPVACIPTPPRGNRSATVKASATTAVQQAAHSTIVELSAAHSAATARRHCVRN